MAWIPRGPLSRVELAATLPMAPPTDIPVDGLWSETWADGERWWRREGDHWAPCEPTDAERESHDLLVTAEVWHSHDRIAEAMGKSFATLVPKIHVGGYFLNLIASRSRWDPETGNYQVRLEITGNTPDGKLRRFEAARDFSVEEVNDAATSALSWKAWVRRQWEVIAQENGFSVWERSAHRIRSGDWLEVTSSSRPPMDKEVVERFWTRVQEEARQRELDQLRADEAEVLKMLQGGSA